jgi:hypothetical protein
MNQITPASIAIWQAELDELAERRLIARQTGGPERFARQIAIGPLTICERNDRRLAAGPVPGLGSIDGNATPKPSMFTMRP